MNPAILMLLMTNNYSSVGSIDEPDHYFDDGLSAGGLDWFAWTVLAILALGLAFAVFITFKR